jgi:hypothetical protein
MAANHFRISAHTVTEKDVDLRGMKTKPVAYNKILHTIVGSLLLSLLYFVPEHSYREIV